MRDEDRTRDQLLDELRRLRAVGRSEDAPAASGVGVWTLDVRSGAVTWTDERWSLFGLPAHEMRLSLDQAMDLIHPDDRPHVERAQAEALADGRPFEYCFRTRHPDGTVRLLFNRGQVVLGADGRPERLVGFVRELAGPGPADPALSHSQHCFQAFFENSLDGILLMDGAGGYVDANPAICQLLGYSREELRRMNVWDVTPAVRREAIPMLMEQFFAAGTLSGEYVMQCKDGSMREVEFRSVANVLPGLHLGLHRDVTQRKRDEQELRRQKETLQAIFDHNPVMISMFAADGLLLLANRSWEQTLGWPLEEARRIDLFAEVTPDEPTRRRAVEFVSAPPPGWTDGRIRARSGAILDTTWAITALSDGTRIAFGQDVTARKKAEQEMADQATRLEALSRRLVEVQEEERRHLARELHDEIGQLLTSLRFAVEASAAGSPEAAAAGLDQARRLIDEALGWVRERSFDLRPALLDHLGLLPALRALIERYTEATGTCVNFRYAGLENRRLAAQLETAAYRVVQEGLTNVARHARVKQAEVRVWLCGGALTVQVEDQGVGFNAEAALAPGQSGGLPGLHERVRLLGGRFALESAPGAGTHLLAELPTP
jgi:PAS domain S-box-containing protein